MIARGLLDIVMLFKVMFGTNKNIGLHVAEVAHDFQQTIQRHVTQDLGLLNSYDTWHGMLQFFFAAVIIIFFCNYIEGTKNVAKTLVKVYKGRGIVKDQLVDKSLFELVYRCLFV